MAQVAKKITKKTSSAKKTIKAKAGNIKKRASSFLKSLPESIEHLSVVQQVAGILEEMQDRAVDVKEEASKELKKLMKRYEGSYKALEKKVHKVTKEAKKHAELSIMHLMQTWHESKEKLPSTITKEVEKLIGHIGAKKTATKKEKKPAAKAKPSKTKASAAIKKKPIARKEAKPEDLIS